MPDETFITDAKLFVTDGAKQDMKHQRSIPLEHTQEINREEIKRMLVSRTGEA